jgi:hypothetical protein
MAETQPTVVTVDGQDITYYEKLHHAPSKQAIGQAALLLQLATPAEGEDPSGRHLGQLLVQSGVSAKQAESLKAYVYSSVSKNSKNPDASAILLGATEILSSALGYMNTQDLPEREKTTREPNLAERMGKLHLPDASRKQNE